MLLAWLLYVGDRILCRHLDPVLLILDPGQKGAVTGFQIHWPSFTKESLSRRKDPEELCDGVSFGLRYEPRPVILNLVKHDTYSNPSEKHHGASQESHDSTATPHRKRTDLTRSYNELGARAM